MPALESLGDDFEIVGAANRSLKSAQLSAKAFNLPLSLRGAKNDEKEFNVLVPPIEVYQGWPAFSGARNVGHLYARIAADIRIGLRSAPSFSDGVALYELVTRIERSAYKGD